MTDIASMYHYNNPMSWCFLALHVKSTKAIVKSTTHEITKAIVNSTKREITKATINSSTCEINKSYS